VYCEKTVGWIELPYVMVVGRVSRRNYTLDGGVEISCRERAHWGVDLRRHIVTDGEFVACLCKNV